MWDGPVLWVRHSIAYCTNASRGLSATAELLFSKYSANRTVKFCLTLFGTRTILRHDDDDDDNENYDYDCGKSLCDCVVS